MSMVKYVALVSIGTIVWTACVPVLRNQNGMGRGSRLASVTMPVPEKLKAFIGPDKINAYSLSITPGACDSGVTGTTIVKTAEKLEFTGATLANEKLRQGCAYTLVLSLGKSDEANTKLEKVYLTNDLSDKRTLISADQTRVVKIQVTAILFITDDGKSELKIDSQLIPVPSIGTSDLDIGIDVGGTGTPNDHIIPPSGADFDWRTVIKTIDVANVGWSGNDYGSSFYRDILSHSQRKLETEGPTTNAHETQHFINNAVRESTMGVHDNTIYVGNGKAGLIIEPSMSPRVVRDYVPEKMRQVSHFNMYIINQINNSWKTEVLYIFDEWSGYRADSRVAIELKRAGKDSILGSEVCITDGAAEFLHFASSAVTALKDKEPEYLKNTQFKAAYALLAEETVQYVKEGAGVMKFDCHASEDLQYFITSPEAERNRQVIREWMGPVWTKRVLGF